MGDLFFARIALQLREQQRNLLEWWRSVPEEEKNVRLGPNPPDNVQQHLRILDNAIQKAEEEELGRCAVCNGYVESHWLETNYTTSVCIDHLSGEERSSLEAELELSQKVQKALLPQSVPSIPGWEVAAFSQPASIVSGDYFDFLHFSDGTLALVIADVMGKGMPASMLMASLQAYLRIIIPESSSPECVLERLNRLFCHNIHLTKFVTIAVIQLDTATGRIRYANAGHNPPVLVRAGRNPEQQALVSLRPTGAAIGLVEAADFRLADEAMEKGDVLVLYTDGVIESRNPAEEDYEEERLHRFLVAHRAEGGADLVRSLVADMRSFLEGRPQGDDTTIVVCRRQPI